MAEPVTTTAFIHREWPEYFVLFLGPPGSGKTTLARMLEQPLAGPYDYIHFDVDSEEVLDAAGPVTWEDYGGYIGRLMDAVGSFVGAPRDPATIKQVVMLEGFPRTADEVDECRWRHLTSGSSRSSGRFPDLVVSLVCNKDEAMDRWLAKKPDLTDENEDVYERSFKVRYAIYVTVIGPMIDGFRQRGVPVVEVDTNDDEDTDDVDDDIEWEFEEVKGAITAFLESQSGN